MNPPILLEAERVRACYGSREIIRSADLHLREGELVALLGLNGSGKTTLLRSLCGLHRLSGGRCRVRGIDCAALREKARARLICYMPQRSGAVYSIRTEEVALMGCNPRLPLFGMPGEGDRKRVRSIFEQLSIAHLWGSDFLHLSEGQKQLVILARAIVQDAPAMLLDEPDSALDYSNRNKILNILRKIVYDNNKAGLLILHDPCTALNHCAQLLLMKEGRLIGSVHPDQDSETVLSEALSQLYGPVQVFRQHNRFFLYPL